MDNKKRFEGKRVFISGPVTGMPDNNYRAFSDAQRYFYSIGAKVAFSPVAHCVTYGEAPHEFYMRRTIAQLIRAISTGFDTRDEVPMYDFIVMLPGWTESNGAKIELAVALACGVKPIIYTRIFSDESCEMNDEDLTDDGNFEDFDTVDNPQHYTSGGIECRDAIKAALTPEEYRGFVKGVCIKYLWRERLKNGDEDLRKAQNYLDDYIMELDYMAELDYED